MRFFSFIVILATAKESSAEKGRGGGAKSGDQHLLTLGTAFNFAYESAILSKDMAVFTVYRIKDRALGVLPPDVSNTITGQYNDLADKVSTLSLQVGVPSCEEMKLKTQLFVVATWQKLLDLLSPVGAATEGVTKPVQEKFSTLFDNFSQAYPQHHAALPTAFYDRIFVLAFLLYVGLTLLGLLKRVICLPCKLMGLCCGKRSASSTKRAGRYSDKGKKTR